MLDRPTEAKSALLAEPGVADALARAAAAVARVDQALIGHPLLAGFSVSHPAGGGASSGGRGWPGD